MGKQPKSGTSSALGWISWALKWILWLLKRILLFTWSILKWLVSILRSSRNEKTDTGSQKPKNCTGKSPPERTKASSKTAPVQTCCSFEGCHWTGDAEALADHQETCIWHLVTCKLCGWTGPFCERKAHKRQCSKASPTQPPSSQIKVNQADARRKTNGTHEKPDPLPHPSIPPASTAKVKQAVETQENPESSLPPTKAKAKQASKKKAGEVSCTNQGCHWVGVEKGLEKHCGVCTYRIVKCDKGCTWRGTFLDLENHYLECPHRLMFCPRKCGAVFKVIDLKSHEATCKKMGHQNQPCHVTPTASVQPRATPVAAVPSQEPSGRGTFDDFGTAEDDDWNDFHNVISSKKAKAKYKAVAPNLEESTGEPEEDIVLPTAEKVGAYLTGNEVADQPLQEYAADDFPALEALAENNFPELSSGVKSAARRIPGRFSKSNAAAIDVKTGRLKGKQSNVRIKMDERCPVCLEPLGLAKCAVLRKCRHQFHAACLEAAAWGATSAGLMCAVCRGKFVWNDIEFCAGGNAGQQQAAAPQKVQSVSKSLKTVLSVDEPPEDRPDPPPVLPQASFCPASEHKLRVPTKAAPDIGPEVKPPEPTQTTHAKAVREPPEPKPTMHAKAAREPPEPKQNVPAKNARDPWAPAPQVQSKRPEPKQIVPAKAPSGRDPWAPAPQVHSTRPPIAVPPKKLSRQERQKNLFYLLDVDRDDRLNSVEMFRFAQMTGFPDDADWESEYELFCQECRCPSSGPNSGITISMFIKLIDDQSDAGCYCVDEEIDEYCADLKAEQDNRAKLQSQAPAPKAKLLSLAEIQQRRLAAGKHLLPEFQRGSVNPPSVSPPAEEEEDKEQEEEEESSDDAFW